MGDPDRGEQMTGSKKHSIDEIIDHMTSDLHSYDGQYILLGSPPNTQHARPEYTNQPMTPHNPVYMQPPYDTHERKIPEYSQQHSLFYQNQGRVPDRPGEMIGMVNVGGGNYVNVVFNPANAGNPMHSYIPSPHSDPNMGYLHYSQPSQQSHVTNSPVHRDYGLFNTGNDSIGNQNNHQLIENVVGNWLPNKSGTYSPFGAVTPTPTDILEDNMRTVRPSPPTQQKKPRIVAEVRPMRPSYSDVLAKSVPTPTTTTTATKPITPIPTVSKSEGKKQSSKSAKQTGTTLNISKTTNLSSNKRQASTAGDDVTKVRPSIALDDLTPPQSSEENSFIDYDSSCLEENIGSVSDNFEFPAVMIKREKKQKKKPKPAEENVEALNNHKIPGNNNGGSKRPLNINNNLIGKVAANEKNVTKSAPKSNRAQDDMRKGISGSFFNSTGNSKHNITYEEKVPSVSRVSKSGGSNASANYKRSQRPTKRKDGQHYLSVLFKRWQEKISHYGIMFLSWFFHLIWDVLAMSSRLLVHLFSVMGETGLIRLVWLREKMTQLVGRDLFIRLKWWNKKPPPPPPPTEPTLPGGLKNNISLPATGDDAMKRLLACKGKDPYSILGVTNHCTDDDIKKYYKRQAVLVHPDKNGQPGAEEAFKILVHAFDIIGEPEKRSTYDRCVAETHQVEQAWSELSELLTQLHHKMEYAANTIRCTKCSKRHKRILMTRPCYAARFCAQCKIHHSAREGDIWAESRMIGLLWHYYACMEGAVYDITEWANCQGDNLKHLKANTHAVQYRIVLGKQNVEQRNRDPFNPDLENFLNNFYTQTGQSAEETTVVNENSGRQRKKTKRKK